MYDNINSYRKPLTAVLLSFAATGLGHIYCGRLNKGLILFGLNFILIPIALSFYLPVDSRYLYPLLISGLVFNCLLFVYAAFDAWRISSKFSASYQLKPFNNRYLYIVLILVSLAYPMLFPLYVKNHIVTAYKIPSSSMAPTILSGDFLLANRVTYTKHSPQSGDIVVFPHPNQRHMVYMKRIVGLPGDSIFIKDRILNINHEPVTVFGTDTKHATETIQGRSYEVQWLENGEDKRDMPDILIPNGYCFVLGDNRNNSQDSRVFGLIPLRDLLGVAQYIYKPAKSWERFGLIEH